MSLRDMIWKGYHWLSRASLSAALIAVLLTSSACSSVKRLEALWTPVEIERPSQAKPNLPNPQPIEINNFKFKVLTETTLPKESGWVYYGLRPQDYEILARNTAEMLRWIKEANWRLKYYRGDTGLDGEAEK